MFRSLAKEAIHRSVNSKKWNQNHFGATPTEKFSSTVTSSNEPLVVTEKIGRVELIGINRPEKKNCVNSATADQLLETFERFDADGSIDAAILYGRAGTFCAGYDLEEASKMSPELLEKIRTRPPMGPSGMLSSKPTIAAIQGFAVGGGLELALWCDLRVMEDTAIMGAFGRRFGVPLIDGGTVRLPKLIGLSRALDLILTGRSVEAQEALQIGLVNRVVSCGTGLGQALNLAQHIVKFPQQCVKVDKASAYNAAYNEDDLRRALAFEVENGSRVLLTESKQGAQRFLEGYGRHGSFNLLRPNKK